jgi:hypothetical protein
MAVTDIFCLVSNGQWPTWFHPIQFELCLQAVCVSRSRTHFILNLLGLSVFQSGLANRNGSLPHLQFFSETQIFGVCAADLRRLSYG